MNTSHWSPAMVAATPQQDTPTAPILCRDDVVKLIPGIDLWDFWPVQHRDGTVADLAGGTLYMMLSAPALPDPDDRHAVARLRLIHKVGDEWRDRGSVLPDGWSPGSREWAGSAVIHDDHRTVTLYFTAAGKRGETVISFDQRLFEARAELVDDEGPRLVHWSEPRESVVPDGDFYMRKMTGGGGIGTIKAFRDPAYFCDPTDGGEYLLFTGSLAQSCSDWNGAVGIAKREGGVWALRPPLVSADGVNNELERPHIVTHDGRYYLFWSTQRKVFAYGEPAGPNGLYGMVADGLAGPWAPLNGTGLVLANPPSAPFQAYSWLVQSDLSVLSFADLVELANAPRDVAEARRHFGGGPAPLLRLVVSGNRAVLV